MSLSMLLGTIIVYVGAQRLSFDCEAPSNRTDAVHSGHIPLAFNLSERRVRHLSDFGTGLLVGAALSIIIPEGVDAVYSATAESEHGHERRDEHHHGSQVTAIALALLIGFITMSVGNYVSQADLAGS